MSDLTVKELKEKLSIIEKDLETLRSTGESGRKLEVLSDYRDYIKDEIKFLENEQRQMVGRNNR